MQRSFVAYLWDIQERGAKILRYVGSGTEEDYRSNSMLQDAVERNLEIIGEMIVQAKRVYPDHISQIRDHARIISFRNELAHGYDNLDEALMSEGVQTPLPDLLAQRAPILEGTFPGA